MKKSKKKPKDLVPEEAQAHMRAEAANEWGAYLTSRPVQAAKLDKDAFIHGRIEAKIRGYKTDPDIRDAYDRWDFHHGYSEPVPKTIFRSRGSAHPQGRDPATLGRGEDF